MIKTKKNNLVLIVGLGNPGEKFVNTPHNAGFLVVDRLGSVYDLRFRIYERLKSEIAEAKLDRQKFILAKPQTFMNKSGEAVKLLAANYKLRITSSLWIVHDDIDLTLGQFKIVKNRGSAGHKGVEDIMKKLKTQDFVRFRVGTRLKKIPLHRPKTLMNTFVVSQLNGKDAKTFEDSLTKCKEAVLLALKEGVEKAANIYNRAW